MTADLTRCSGASCAGGVHGFLRARWGGLGGLVRHFPRNGVVVDLGCGEGILAGLLVGASPGIRVVAVDAHERRIARLRARGLPGVEAVHARIEGFPIPSCDAVALVDVLHYFDGPTQEAILDRAARALSPGGVLVLRDPDAGAGLRFRFNRLHERIFLALGWTLGGNGRYRTGAEWKGLLAARGLAATEEPLRPRSPYADRVVVGRK